MNKQAGTVSPGSGPAPTSFPRYVMDATAGYGDRIALIDGLTEEKLTYRDLASGVRSVAAALVARGMQRGEVTAIIASNSIWYPMAVNAIGYAGGVFTTLNPLSNADEVEKLLRLTEATRVIIDLKALIRLRAALEKLNVKEIITFGEVDGFASFASLIQTPPLEEEVGRNLSEDILGLMFSSGTSGLPKAVMLTNENFTSAAEQVRSTEHFHQGEHLLAALPFFHIYGLVTFMGVALSKGCTLVVLPGFDFEIVLKLIQSYRIAVAPVVAPIAQLFAKHALVDHFDLSSLRLVISGASPISPETLRVASERLKAPVVNAWGLTETTTVGAIAALKPSANAWGSVGKLFPGMEARTIAVGTGELLGPGEEGELLVRGPNIMKGYFKNESATKEVLDENGWLRTGDVGRVDDERNIFIFDRAKEFIKCKGFQVSPAEIEGVLMTHPAVAEAGVIPSPDAEAGEIPKAFVVKRAAVTEHELFDYVAERVAPYKKIREVEFIDQIPRTPAGKILRRVLVLREREKLEKIAALSHRLRDRVVVTRHGAILSICLDRPRKMNAFDKDMFDGLAEAVTMLEDDPTLRVGMLHANGLVFCSGLDTVSAGPLAARGQLKLDPRLIDLLEIQPGTRRRTKPMVAAIHGKCLNLGVELAAVCDVVIAADDAVFSQKEVARGLFPFGSATINLPPKIGLGNALFYILTADDFSANRAREMGLVQETVNAENLLPHALEIAQRIAANSPLGVVAALASIRTMREQGPLAALADLPAEVVRLTSTEDFKEGVKAFLEKRPPQFTGR